MRYVALCLLLAACGSTDAAKTCADADYGTLRITYTERADGSCGPVPDAVAVDTALPPQGGAGGASPWPACSVRSVFHETACDLAERETCTAEDGSSVQASAHVGTGPDGAPTNGILQVVAYDAAGVLSCESTYDLAFKR